MQIYLSTNLRIHLEKLVLTQLVKNSPPLTETERTLPCSQQPANGPYLEPADYNPRPHNLFKNNSDIKFPYTDLRLGLRSSLFPPRFPIEIVSAFLISSTHLTSSTRPS
jgi:hypothetical protein